MTVLGVERSLWKGQVRVTLPALTEPVPTAVGFSVRNRTEVQIVEIVRLTNGEICVLGADPEAALTGFQDLINKHVDEAAKLRRCAEAEDKKVSELKALMARFSATPSFVPCSPGCRGVLITDWAVPSRWVSIERCDECSMFISDDEAARYISDEVRSYCIECQDMCSCKDPDHHVCIIVPMKDALESGLITSKDGEEDDEA